MAAVLIVLGVVATVTGRDKEETQVATGSEHPLTLDGHIAWTVAVMNREIEATDDALRARYAERFLAAVPPSEFRAALVRVQDGGPWRVLAEVERRGQEVVAVQLEARSREQARLTVSLDADGRVIGSTVLMATPCAAPVDAATALAPALETQRKWLDELLTSGRTPSDDELRDHFSPRFLAQVPVDQIKSGLVTMRGLGPLTMRHFEGPLTDVSFVARVGVNSGEEARYVLGIETPAPHRIEAFGIRTAQPCRR